MKKNIVLTFLKAIWSKGLVVRICVASLSAVLVGGATTGVVLLQNKKIEKSNNDMDEEKKNVEAQEITNHENDDSKIKEVKVNEENSETISQNETPKTNETSKELTTEQGAQPTTQEQNNVQQPEKQETQQPEAQPAVSYELIVAQRKINQGYRDYLTSDSSSRIVRFGVVDMNGNGEEELLLYTYDPTTSSDRGPNEMLFFDGEVCGAGEGWGYLENIEYCSTTKHFVTTNYYDDGSYDFSIYEFNGYFGPELIHSDGDGDWPFVFHVDANGKYSWGGRDNLYYTQKLTDSQVAYVVQKMNEFLPTRTKATASYLINEENLNKYLPVDDAGITQQILARKQTIGN